MIRISIVFYIGCNLLSDMGGPNGDIDDKGLVENHQNGTSRPGYSAPVVGEYYELSCKVRRIY